MTSIQKLRQELMVNHPPLWAAIYDKPDEVCFGVIAAYFLLPRPDPHEINLEQLCARLLAGIVARKEGREPLIVPTVT